MDDQSDVNARMSKDELISITSIGTLSEPFVTIHQEVMVAPK